MPRTRELLSQSSGGPRFPQLLQWMGADPRGYALHVTLFLSSDEAHAKIQLRRQFTMLNCDFYSGWVSPVKSPIPKTFSEWLHWALSRHLLSGNLTLHGTASCCTPGQLASLALRMGASGAGICRLRRRRGPGTGSVSCSTQGVFPRWWRLQEECDANLHQHPQPAACTGALQIAL